MNTESSKIKSKKIRLNIYKIDIHNVRLRLTSHALFAVVVYVTGQDWSFYLLNIVSSRALSPWLSIKIMFFQKLQENKREEGGNEWGRKRKTWNLCINKKVLEDTSPKRICEWEVNRWKHFSILSLKHMMHQ